MAKPRGTFDPKMVEELEGGGLKQPTIDPIMLLTSMLSGGISGFQNASAEQKALDAMRKLVGPKFLEELGPLKDIPVLGKTIMDALGGGANFGGAAALNSKLMPGHPLAANILAMPMFPAGLVGNQGEAVENWMLKNHPGIQDILGRLKPLMMAPALLGGKKDAR